MAMLLLSPKPYSQPFTFIPILENIHSFTVKTLHECKFRESYFLLKFQLCHDAILYSLPRPIYLLSVSMFNINLSKSDDQIQNSKLNISVKNLFVKRIRHQCLFMVCKFLSLWKSKPSHLYWLCSQPLNLSFKGTKLPFSKQNSQKVNLCCAPLFLPFILA